MRQFFIPWASLFLATAAGAQTIHISHCLEACPEVSRADNEVVIRHLYAASIDQDSGLAEWVAYRVLADSVGVASLLPRWWQQDELLQNTSQQVLADEPDFVQPDLSNAQDREYRINEIDITSTEQGRLTPMTSFAGTPYWEELNYLSNMSPLPQSLRMGSWSRLDQAVNEQAAQSEVLYVVSGPLYSYTASPDANEQLPTSYFKVISDGSQVAAFIFDADLPPHAHHCDQLASLQQIEARLDRQLLPARPDLAETGIYQQLGCSQ